jgi:hypothetical protein
MVSIETSEDGINFKILERKDAQGNLENTEVKKLLLNFDINTSIRYLRITAENQKVCPPWHPSAGGKAWLFMDEIIVD